VDGRFDKDFDASAINPNGGDKSANEIEKDLMLFGGNKSELRATSSLTNKDIHESYEQRISHEVYKPRNIRKEALFAEH